MDSPSVATLRDEILALPEVERQALAQEVLPVLLLTPVGLSQINEARATGAAGRGADGHPDRRALRATHAQS